MRKADDNTVVKELISSVREFLRERDWERFHNPKDLAESICIEAAELLQLFQWQTPAEAATFIEDSLKVEELQHELADVVIYCLSLANTLEIDLTNCVLNKLRINREKYPAEICREKAQP